MIDRKFGLEINIDQYPRGLKNYYKAGFKVFEFTMRVVNQEAIKSFSRKFHNLTNDLPEDDEIEFYLRTPSLSFTGIGDYNLFPEILDLCDRYEIYKLVLKPGEAISDEVSHKEEAIKKVINFMNQYGSEFLENRFQVFWENSSKGFGSIENIIDILTNKDFRYPRYFKSKLNFEGYVEGKYSLEDACEFAADLFLANPANDHRKILEYTKEKTIFLTYHNGDSFKYKLNWEESRGVVDKQTDPTKLRKW